MHYYRGTFSKRKESNKEKVLVMLNDVNSISKVAGFRRKIIKSCGAELKGLNGYIKAIKGHDSESRRSEGLRNAALTFLLFPVDPTGITYAVGLLLYSVSYVVKNSEVKSMGVRDVIRTYGLVNIMFRDIINGNL